LAGVVYIILLSKSGEFKMTVINTNVNATFAHAALTTNARAQTHAMQELSTGKRINSAKDDAAGLAMSETMTAQIRGLNMAVRNANDAVSLCQTADGAMIEQTNMLQRMRELAVQASSDTTDTVSKGYLNSEFTALRSEIDRIGLNTQWNAKPLLDGSFIGSSGVTGSYSFQVGANGADTKITIAIGKMTASSSAGVAGTLTSISASRIKSGASASSAIASLDTALAAIANQRAAIGATMNQLTYAADNLTNVSQNTTDSRSRILDTDYATAKTNLSRTQIISQAATAMLAQANQQSQTVLSLLKG